MLDRATDALRRPRLRRVVGLFYDDPGFRARYQECPGSTAGHHAELGGLLRHTAEVAAIGQAIARASGADEELVAAGALLHDIGKLEAYDWQGGGFELTEAGALLGHVTLGMLMLSRRLATASSRPCSNRETLILQHLLASHHGVLEHGAPARPMTLEAEVLHHADNASAKCRSMADVLSRAEHFAGSDLISTRALWQLDHRRAYRGGSSWGLEG